jgi:hypothetical protein
MLYGITSTQLRNLHWSRAGCASTMRRWMFSLMGSRRRSDRWLDDLLHLWRCESPLSAIYQKVVICDRDFNISCKFVLNNWKIGSSLVRMHFFPGILYNSLHRTTTVHGKSASARASRHRSLLYTSLQPPVLIWTCQGILYGKLTVLLLRMLIMYYWRSTGEKTNHDPIFGTEEEGPRVSLLFQEAEL